MEELKQERAKRGLTLKQFSELIGVPVRTYEKWERGERVAPDYVIKLIKFFLDHQ